MALGIATGVVAALLAGRRRGARTGPALRWLPLLLAGAVAQWVPEVVALPEAVGAAAVLCSYAALVAFTAGNLAHAGMPLVLLGVGLNLVVVAANGGMPVRADALVRAGIAAPAEVERLDLGARRHLESGDDVLSLLGDVVPVPPLREVVSAGDVVLATGLAVVAFGALRPGPRSPAAGTGGGGGGRDRSPPRARSGAAQEG